MKKKSKQKTAILTLPPFSFFLFFLYKKKPLKKTNSRLATVMLAREGGVEKALEAVPFLHDETHAYIKTVSLLAKNPALGDIKNWQGMSAKAALGVSKNYTSGAINDAVTSKFAAGQAAIEPIVNSIVPDALVNNAKANATTALLDKVGSAVAGPLNDDAFVDTLNAQLEKFNIRVTAKSVTAPSKFTPAAAVIARAATGESMICLCLLW